MRSMDIKREEIEYGMYNKDESGIIEKMSVMIGSELSEPYSIFTYYYFLDKWPELCYIAYHNGKIVGIILGKLEIHNNNSSITNSTNWGYIAMIVVSKDYRRLGIAKKLVLLYIHQVRISNGDEVVLETESDNLASLSLYERNLSFLYHLIFRLRIL